MDEAARLARLSSFILLQLGSNGDRPTHHQYVGRTPDGRDGATIPAFDSESAARSDSKSVRPGLGPGECRLSETLSRNGSELVSGVVARPFRLSIRNPRS